MTFKAPEGLAPETAAWWLQVHADYYGFEPHHTRVLTLAAFAWDRTAQARDVIAEHGLTYIDRLGNPRARQEITIEKDSLAAFCRCIRELDLDVDTPSGDRSRPPGIISNGRTSHAG